RGSRKIDDLDRRFTVERLLERQIALADSTAFRGDAHQVEFTTPYSLANGPADTVRVRYEIDRTANGLIYSETPFAQYAPGQTAGGLCKRFTGFSMDGFRYLYTMPNKQREWAEQTMQEKPNQKIESVLAIRIGVAGDVLTIPIENTQ